MWCSSVSPAREGMVNRINHELKKLMVKFEAYFHLLPLSRRIDDDDIPVYQSAESSKARTHLDPSHEGKAKVENTFFPQKTEVSTSPCATLSSDSTIKIWTRMMSTTLEFLKLLVPCFWTAHRIHTLHPQWELLKLSFWPLLCSAQSLSYRHSPACSFGQSIHYLYTNFSFGLNVACILLRLYEIQTTLCILVINSTIQWSGKCLISNKWHWSLFCVFTSNQ